MKYLAMIVGGLGPDVWDKEVDIDAADFKDAAALAAGHAEEIGGEVYLIETSPHEFRAVRDRDARIAELTDLLTSARAIAERKGADTAWWRFSERLAKAGIGSVTAKVFKVLPSDAESADYIDEEFLIVPPPL